MIDLCPHLQALILRNVDQIDHATLEALGKPIRSQLDERIRRQNLLPEFGSGIKLLDLSHCSQVTGKGLATILSKLDGLVWLDLSGTGAVRDPAVMLLLRQLLKLRMLTLKNCQLDDTRMASLAKAIGRRVRWLDVEGNEFTSRALEIMQEQCCSDSSHATEAAPPAYDSAVTLSSTNRDSRPEDFADNIRRVLTSGSKQYLLIEEAAEFGLTHLRFDMKDYNSGPNITLSKVLDGLTYLDLGSGSESSMRGLYEIRLSRLKYLRIRYWTFGYRLVHCPNDENSEKAADIRLYSDYASTTNSRPHLSPQPPHHRATLTPSSPPRRPTYNRHHQSRRASHPSTAALRAITALRPLPHPAEDRARDCGAVEVLQDLRCICATHQQERALAAA